MQRQKTSSTVSSRRRVLNAILLTGFAFSAGNNVTADEIANIPFDIAPSQSQVGVGVLLPSPTDSNPVFEIAKRPSFWDRFMGTQPEETNALNPPQPPMVSDPSKMTPPSAVWTPPQDPKVVIPSPKTATPSLESGSTEPSGNDGWTQRGNAVPADPPSLQVKETPVGSGLSASQETSGDEQGGLEPATSVIRLLPVGSQQADATDDADDSSVVILKAPIANEPQSQATTSSSEEAQALPSGTAAIATTPSVKGQEIASADEDPIPLRDPQDLMNAEAPTDSTGIVSENEQEGGIAFTIDDQDGKVLARESQAQPEKVALESDADQEVTSSRRNVVVRDVRIKRDGSPSTEDDLANGVNANQDSGSSNSGSNTTGSNTTGPSEDGSTIVMDEDESDAGDLVVKQETSGNSAEMVEQDPISVEAPQMDYVGYPKVPMELSRSVLQMQAPMSQCLKYYFGRPESANIRSNWGMLHSIMVWGADTPIIAGDSQYNAIAWIAGNNRCAGKTLLIQENGRMVATTGIGLQGHQAQFLAVLALCNVPSDYPLYAGNTQYTIEDLVKEEMLACRSGEELTFSLIGLSHYLDTDTRWTNADGETWDLPRLLKEEMSQPIVGSACGGTHRLMGFAHALRKRRMEGREISGQWKRAEIYTDDFVQYVFKLQNRDGSMSTDWFEGREDNGSMDRKVQTTGHMVEWLLSVLPDSQLQDPRLVSAVSYITNAMNQNRTHEWKIGPKGHALRSLAMYYERVFQEGPAWQSLIVASEDGADRR